MSADGPDFGTTLREARERRGVTLRQIASATKIAVSVLDGLERNDISRLPGGIFGRAFVRSYAAEVGLDPEATIRQFITQFPHDSVTVGHPTSDRIEDRDAIESDRRMASTFLRLMAISVPIAGIVLYYAMSNRDRAASPALRVTSTAAVAPASADVPLATAPDVAATAPQPSVATPAADLLTVALSIRRTCWISATVDGQKRIERLVQSGEQLTIEVHREMVLTTGDASAIAVTLNGAGARPLGRSGEVVTVRFDLANFKDYLPHR
jgi:cytoskeleton protein RodZ